MAQPPEFPDRSLPHPLWMALLEYLATRPNGEVANNVHHLKMLQPVPKPAPTPAPKKEKKPDGPGDPTQN